VIFDSLKGENSRLETHTRAHTHTYTHTGLATHNLILDSLGVWKYLLKPITEARYLMNVVSKNEA